jgi:hypothetical protein
MSNRKTKAEIILVNYIMPILVVAIVLLALYGMIFDKGLELDIKKICGAIVLNAFVLFIVLITKLRANTKEITIVEPVGDKDE